MGEEGSGGVGEVRDRPKEEDRVGVQHATAVKNDWISFQYLPRKEYLLK